jgi:hypothetical protein
VRGGRVDLTSTTFKADLTDESGIRKIRVECSFSPEGALLEPVLFDFVEQRSMREVEETRGARAVAIRLP